MRFLFLWLLEKRSTVAGSAAAILFGITLLLRYGFGLWWPWGIIMATALGVVAVMIAATE